ncbi:hypothetical protein GCM10010196_23510 [Agromyces mediolanus]|uniref:Uncharacterized protein n=1 Tax=Agromyces mediolanus TaxID=41986 RepID=A0A918FBW2_AGRME|nr:hypothetical protein GCM10010196_23510 [Agromyces mediolanus]GLJ72147.1 hypothetical protein GCM10017583_14030 [Agromyces mediolanus]
MTEPIPTASEYASGGYGRTADGRPRPLTPKERAQAERSASIRGESIEQAADRLRGTRR